MARARKKGDDATNARKRERRAAKRYLDRAENASGAARAKYESLARQHFEAAMQTYDPKQKQKLSSDIVNIAARLGIDIQGQRSEFTVSKTEKGEKMRERAITESAKSLESYLSDPAKRREEEAKTLLKNRDIAKGIFGGLIDIWKDEASYVDENGETKVDTSRIYEIVFDYFGVDNLADLLDKLEQQIGESLYSASGSDEWYDVTKTVLQTKYKRGELAA